MDKLVSIVVPVYNSEKHLEKTINSIREQSYENIQIILINDGSTDSSLNICEKNKKIDKRIKVLSIENQGVSQARNVGLDNSTGDYIYFVDAGDYILENAVSVLVNNLESNSADISIIGYSVVYKSGEIQKMSDDKLFKVYTHEEAMKEWMSIEIFKGFVWDKMFKKELFKKIYFPNNIVYMEDVYVGNYLFAKATSVVYSGIPLYMYVQDEDSITHSPFKKEFLEGFQAIDYMIQFSKKNYGKYNSEAYSRLILTSYNFICSIYSTDNYKKFPSEIKILKSHIKKNKKYIIKGNISKGNKVLISLIYLGVSPKLVLNIRRKLLTIKRKIY